MTSRILVATDFSPAAAAAVEEAHVLGERLGARLELLHVAEDYSAEEWRHRPAVTAWLASAGVADSEILTRSGVPWVEVVRRAEEIDAVLLIIGSHGQSGFHPLRLGTTAARIAGVAPCPTVVVGARRFARGAAPPPSASRTSHATGELNGLPLRNEDL